MKSAWAHGSIPLFLAFFTSLLFAQQPSGTITGKVGTVGQAPILSAVVTAKSESTGFTRSATTGANGVYVLPLLPADSYEISAGAPGFYRIREKGISVSANVVLTVNLELPAGEVSDIIIVESGSSQIDTSTGTLRQVIEQKRVAELPLVDRNPTRLLLLEAGTSDQSNPSLTGGGGEQARVTGTTSAVQVSYPGTLVISSNGSRTDSVEYILDGGANRDIYTNVNSPLPNPEALQEFVVQTGNVSAEYRSAAGGVVTVTTKSGSNQLHGSAYDFLRNDALNAAPFFNNASGGGRDALKRNQFGGTLGGPVLKDRFFFFGSYQGLRIRKGATRMRYVVPTDRQRAGIFGAGSVSVDPLSAALLDYIPHASNQNTGEVFLNKFQNDNENQYLTKLDLLGSRHQLLAKYFNSRYPKGVVPGVRGNLYLGMPGYDFRFENISAGLNSTIGNGRVNDLTFAYSGLKTLVTGASPIGMNDLNPKVAGIKEINVVFGGGLSSINFLGRDRDLRRASVQVTDGAHWVLGRHDVAFGGYLMRSSLYQASVFRQAGFYTFAGPQDFIVGNLKTFTQGGGEFTQKTHWNRSLYLNDDFRVSSRLALNLGIRWEPFEPPVDKDKKAICIVRGRQSTRFPNAPSDILFGGETGCPDAGFRTIWTSFAPRVGFAYNILGQTRTVLRGGLGLAFQPPFLEALNNMVAIPPFSPQVALSNTRFSDPFGFLGLQNPFPQQFGPRAGSPTDRFTLPVIVASYDPKWSLPRVWNYNVTIERQVSRDILLRASYIGAIGRKLAYNTDFNFPRSLADLARGIRPFPAFGKMTQNQSILTSDYNALQLAVTKRLSRAFSLDVHYSWAKSIDDVSSISDLDKINVFNPLDPLGSRAVSDYDVRHRFVLNFLWESPELSQQRIVGHLLRGWHVSGIGSAQSGAPFSVVSNNNISDSYETNLSQSLGMLVGSPSLNSGAEGHRINQWFNTAAFAPTPNNSFGTAFRNMLTGPGQFTIDLAISKAAKIREEVQLEYRAEFFNALNHANFYLPNSNVGRVGVPNPDFGKITGTMDPRIIQMALKLRF